MRFSSTQINLTKRTVDEVLTVPNKVWLFGSRIDDNQRGGDIDLFIETPVILPNRAVAICELYGALVMALGDCKIDIILKDANTVSAPIFDIAKRTGILL